MKLFFVLIITANVSFLPYKSVQPYTFGGGQERQDSQGHDSNQRKTSQGESLPESQRPITDADVLPGKALKKAQPKYPKEAKKARVEGTVKVNIVVDEKGRVVKADAVSGDVLLREAAEKAALKWRFEPTLLFGKPVKVTGLLSFNFALR